MKKYTSPFPVRQITGNDFNELVDYLNSTIEESNLTNEKLHEILKRINSLNDETDIRIKEFKNKIDTAQQLSNEINKKNKKLAVKLDSFYARQIELFGIFIAIFSFIIAGIQITTKADGDFLDKLSTSTAIFLPITFAISILLYLIKRIIKS